MLSLLLCIALRIVSVVLAHPCNHNSSFDGLTFYHTITPWDHTSKIESSRLATKERLQKLIAIKSIIAFKILYLAEVALSNPTETYAKILSNEEWKVLYMREYQVATLSKEPPNIKQAIIWLGKLGGFTNRKSDRGYDSMAELRKSQGEHSYASHNDLSKLWVKVRV